MLFLRAILYFALFCNTKKLFKKSLSLGFSFGFVNAYEFIMFWHFVCLYDFALC